SPALLPAAAEPELDANTHGDAGRVAGTVVGPVVGAATATAGRVEAGAVAGAAPACVAAGAALASAGSVDGAAAAGSVAGSVAGAAGGGIGPISVVSCRRTMVTCRCSAGRVAGWVVAGLSTTSVKPVTVSGLMSTTFLSRRSS